MSELSDSDCVPVGTCSTMCPASEANFRTRNHLIHPLECVEPSLPTKLLRAEPSKMVKQYARSAAGCNLLVAELLRPTPVLEKTVDYLLNMFQELKEDRLGQVYSFVLDRLRAVRQDMVVQRLNGQDTLMLLEKMIPFYIEAEYLCKTVENNNFYDWKLHSTQLEDCFSTWTACLSNKFNPDILAVLILRNRSHLNHLYPLLPSLHRKTVIDLILSMDSGNFVRFFRTLAASSSRILPLSLVDAVRQMRIRALSVISIGFKARGAVLPLSTVSSWLSFDSPEDAQTVSSHFSLLVDSNLVVPSIDLSKPVPTDLDRILFKYDCLL